MIFTTIRLAGPQLQLFINLRHHALQEAPDAFADTFDIVVNQPPAQHAHYLKNNTVLGLLADNTLIGSVTMAGLPARLNHNCELSKLYVMPEFRHTGAANKLMTAFYEKMAAQNLRGCILSVAGCNARAIRFYHRHGFKEFGRLSEQFRSTQGLVDGIHMVKRLEV